MEILIISFSAMFISIIVLFRLREYNIMLKKIILEDKIHTHLNKPLTIKDYKKVYGGEFKPYQMKMNSDINKEIFKNFSEFYDYRKKENDYTHPTLLNIVFINKIRGYIYDNTIDSYDITIKKDSISFSIDKKEYIDILDRIFDLKYNLRNEYNMDGVIKINNKTYFLDNLTSISIYKNTIKEIDFSDIVFKFGSITEVVRFNSFEESFKYLFCEDRSDIRLIEKIANTSLIRERRGY
jgi:hypothetical protein